MTENEHYWNQLGEESGEVAKCVSKIMRFGPGDVNVMKPNGPDNLERLVDEMNDWEAASELLVERGLIPPDWRDDEKKAAKKKKIAHFVEYARRNCGTVQG